MFGEKTKTTLDKTIENLEGATKHLYKLKEVTERPSDILCRYLAFCCDKLDAKILEKEFIDLGKTSLFEKYCQKATQIRKEYEENNKTPEILRTYYPSDIEKA